MAGILSTLRQNVAKFLLQNNPAFNKVFYQWLGNAIVWNTQNNQTFIKEGYQGNATVYSIINRITAAASTVPYIIYQVKDANSAKRYKSLMSGTFDESVKHKAEFIKKQAFEEVYVPELEQLLQNPNNSQGYASFITNLIAFGKLTGNRYIWGISPISGPNTGKPQELHILPSQETEIISGGMLRPVAGYKVSWNPDQEIPASDVCHIKDFNPDYNSAGTQLYGQSPLQAGFKVLTQNNEAATTGVKYLQNQMARGMLTNKDGNLTEVQATQLKQKFKDKYQGPENAGDIVITPANLEWVNFGLPASDLSLIEQYNASVKDLCNIYGVPVQLLNNTDSSTFNNMKEAKKSLYQNAIIPELIKIRDELNRWLVPKFGEDLYLDFDFSAIPELQDDMDKLVNQLSAAWWITPNEKREAMNYGQDQENETFNDYYIPANLAPSQISLPPFEPSNT